MDAFITFILNSVLTQANVVAALMGLFWWIERRERSQLLKEMSTKFSRLAEVIRIISEVSTRQQIMCKQTEDLWNWHERADEDGVKVWYIKKSLEKHVETLATNETTQTEVMKRIVEQLEKQNQLLTKSRWSIK